MEIKNIPLTISSIISSLEKSHFEAYLVGGCVRDLLLGSEPKDWDVATNATPEQIQKIFPESVYENEFGTVLVKIASSFQLLPAEAPLNGAKEGLASSNDIVEITTYRKEGKYTDKRHPDEIKFAKTIEEDLARRDFTINAIALGIRNKELGIREKEKSLNPLFIIHNSRFEIIDPFNGQKDLQEKIIRTVGNPEDRFNEDALRLMRAVRLAAELNFGIEKKTAEAIEKFSDLLEMIAKERIRDELIKLIMSEWAADAIRMMAKSGLLKYVIPELLEGVDVGQNKHHIYNVFDHNVRALAYSVKNNYSLEVRLASLLHDVGKPQTKRGDGPNSTFYAHEIVGAKMTLKILDRLRFSRKMVEKISHLVRCHLFYYNVGEVTETGVRRFLRRVGPENVDDLIKVREADRIGSGVPKAVPYKLRHLLFMIEKVKQDPIHPKMLKINGDDVKKWCDLPQSMRVGYLLSILLEEVLDDPNKNETVFLKSRVLELNKLSDEELKTLSQKARQSKNEFESDAEAEIKKKYYVK